MRIVIFPTQETQVLDHNTMKQLAICSVAVCLTIGLLASLYLDRQGVSTVMAADAPDSIGVRYADACLRLAKLELTRALELNERVPRAKSATRIDWLKANVAAAEEQVRIAREYQQGSTMPLQAAYADATAMSATAEFQAAKQFAESNPGVMSELQLDKLQLQAEIAGLRAEMWRDSSNLPSLVDQMQWQIDRLTEEVIELDQRVRALE